MDLVVVECSLVVVLPGSRRCPGCCLCPPLVRPRWGSVLFGRPALVARIAAAAAAAATAAAAAPAPASPGDSRVARLTVAAAGPQVQH